MSQSFQDVEDPRIFRKSAQEDDKVVRPKLRPPWRPRKILGARICYRLRLPHGHSVTGRIKSMKNFKEAIGNRSRYFKACSAVSQPTALPRTSLKTLFP